MSVEFMVPAVAILVLIVVGGVPAWRIFRAG